MPRLGPLELVIILLIFMLIFGAGRLPYVGSSLGRSMRAFKNAITGQDEEDDNPKKRTSSKPRVKSSSGTKGSK